MKGKRTDLSEHACAASRALAVVGDWWSLLIVRDALTGLQRFGEFQKNLGLAKNILSARLKKLVESGVFRVEPDPDAASRNVYVLTERGRGLAVVIAAIWQWGEENCFPPGERAPLLVDTVTDQPFAKLSLSTVDGKDVDTRALQMGLRRPPAPRKARSSKAPDAGR